MVVEIHTAAKLQFKSITICTVNDIICPSKENLGLSEILCSKEWGWFGHALTDDPKTKSLWPQLSSGWRDKNHSPVLANWSIPGDLEHIDLAPTSSSRVTSVWSKSTFLHNYWPVCMKTALEIHGHLCRVTPSGTTTQQSISIPNGLFSIFHVMVPATQTMMLQTQTKQTLCDAPHSLITVVVLPGKKEEKEPLSWGRLISGAEVWVDLQSKQQ